MFRCIGKQSGNHAVSPEEEKESYGWKDLQKRKVLTFKPVMTECGVMDDQSNELVEPMEEVFTVYEYIG